MAVAVVLAIIILFGLIKKLIKLVLIVLSFLILWVAYMVMTGNQVDMNSIKESLQSGVEAVGEKVSDLGETMKDSAQKKIKEEANKKLDDLLGD
ncbi:MAG: hypothetical protein V3S22_02540 [Candidatus Neomarinimicrobiota bacterium]